MAKNCEAVCPEIQRVNEWIGLAGEYDGADIRRIEAEDTEYLANFESGCDICPGPQLKMVETKLSYPKLRRIIGKPAVINSIHLECPRTGTLSEEPVEGILV